MTDQSAMLSDLFNNPSGGEVVLGAQTYVIDQGVQVGPGVKGLKIRGQSMASTILTSNGANGYALWFRNAIANQADNGIDLSDLTILDTSGTGACDSLLRITQFNDVYLHRVNLRGAKGRRYADGTVTVAQGSNLVIGANTAWTAKMAPGHLWVNGYPQEVLEVTGANTLTLCTPWQRPSVQGAVYALDSGGAGLLLEGTSVNGCTQYGTADNLKGFGNRVGVWCQGRPTGGAGVSAFRFTGGRMGGFAGTRVANSIGAWFGTHTDTCVWDIPVNNVALGVGIEDGHQHSIVNRAENDPPFCAITPGGPAGQAATKGVLVTGSRHGACFNNYIFPQSVYGFGNGVEWNAGATAGLTVDMRRCPLFGNINSQVGPA